ncbi:MAG: tyrosine-type recombinase/integrase, partial [Planctomycetaceae bacterium]
MASVFKRGGKNNRNGRYYVSWVDHNGKRQSKSAKTTDKATAERIARKREADAALRRDGVVDAALEGISRESQRSVESHLADYEAKLRAANRTEKHVAGTARMIRAVAEFAGFQTAADVNADGVNRYAGKLKDEGLSARTIQSHLTAIKSFVKWLTENHKLPRDPLASVKKPNPKADRRKERRMLTPDEWRRLETATLEPEQYGMTAPQRLLLYRTAIQTGLRSNELRSLTRGRLFLDAEPPYITCKAGSTKNRKDARQYIQPELAAELRAAIATKAPKAPLFNMPHTTNVARMLRDDLSAARKAWLKESRRDPDKYSRREQDDFLAARNHDGESIDFHSLRHTCGAWLAMSGVHPKVVQTVMRHSSITLTMDTYGHLFPGQEADAVAQMRPMMIDPPEALNATGTADATAETANKAQR